MKLTRIAALAALAGMFAAAADARAVKLKLAKPQPEALTEGLSVQYAFPDDVKSLRDAYVALGIGGQSGEPLAGLNYQSSADAPGALTSGQETKVAARVTGYIRFDEPGTYTLNLFSNDGVEFKLGGREIAKVDEKRGCDPVDTVEVRAPKAGWYEVEILWWQRKGGSCLILEWAPEDGEFGPVPAAAFGY